jgi:hypothetical protein
MDKAIERSSNRKTEGENRQRNEEALRQRYSETERLNLYNNF